MTSIIRSTDRPVQERGPELPTLQRLVDRENGSSAVTVLVNHFAGHQSVPPHTHEVEEVLIVVSGECVLVVDGSELISGSGDAVIVPPGVEHSIDHRSADDATVVAVLASPDVRIGGTS